MLQDNVLYGSIDNANKIWGYVAVTSPQDLPNTFHIERRHQVSGQIETWKLLMHAIKIKNELETFNGQKHDNLKNSKTKIKFEANRYLHWGQYASTIPFKDANSQHTLK